MKKSFTAILLLAFSVVSHAQHFFDGFFVPSPGWFSGTNNVLSYHLVAGTQPNWPGSVTYTPMLYYMTGTNLGLNVPHVLIPGQWVMTNNGITRLTRAGGNAWLANDGTLSVSGGAMLVSNSVSSIGAAAGIYVHNRTNDALYAGWEHGPDAVFQLFLSGGSGLVLGIKNVSGNIEFNSVVGSPIYWGNHKYVAYFATNHFLTAANAQFSRYLPEVFAQTNKISGVSTNWVVITNGNISASGDVNASTFTGSGAALTDLNGSAISSGTVADARLPAGLTRDSEIDDQAEQDALGMVTKTGAQTVTGNKVFTHIRRLKTDLAGGTALTVGQDYWDTFTTDRTLTFSGTPGEGSVIILHADVTTESTLTIPTSEVDGGDGSTITSVLLPVGYHNLCWIYVNSEWVLSGAPTAATTPSIEQVLAQGSNANGHSVSNLAVVLTTNIYFLNADAGPGSIAIAPRITASSGGLMDLNFTNAAGGAFRFYGADVYAMNQTFRGAFNGEGSGLTAVNAATGDSATAFFSSGTIEPARLDLTIATNGINTGVIPVLKTTYTNLTGNITIAGFSGADPNGEDWWNLVATNAWTTNLTITFPASVSTVTNTYFAGKVLTIAGGKWARVSGQVATWGTNAAAVVFTP